MQQTQLPLSFFAGDDVVAIARNLIGNILVSSMNGKISSGRIVETEAYRAFTDKASHSFGGKRTLKNEHMYASAGTAYVYICYGMHRMMNIVTNERDIPEAVLIRALEPLKGQEIMRTRTGKSGSDHLLCRGPGNVTKAMGIEKKHSGLLLGENELQILASSLLPQEKIAVSPRIGVDSAGKDALLPYRFFVAGHACISGPSRLNISGKIIKI